MKEKNNTWGGSRKGAGAKTKGDSPRVSVAFRVKPETAATIRRMADEQGMSQGEILDLLAK